MVEVMKAQKLWPGCWYDNNRVSTSSKTFHEHPEWLSMEESGKPYVLKGTGYGDFGFLDASLPAVVAKYRQDAANYRNVGMRYCFADFTSEAMISPSRSHDPTLTAVEVSRRAQVAVRQGFGEGFYWLSQQTPASIFGLADAMRHRHRLRRQQQAGLWRRPLQVVHEPPAVPLRCRRLAAAQSSAAMGS